MESVKSTAKICSCCKIEKPVTEFYIYRKGAKNKLTQRGECCTCFKKKKSDRAKKINQQYEEWFKKIPKECEKCGENRPYLIDFHHVDPMLKTIEISTIKSKAWSLKKKIELAEKEMQKCIQLCSNCHREFHHLERNYEMTLDEYL